jgi:hypothetical protein
MKKIFAYAATETHNDWSLFTIRHKNQFAHILNITNSYAHTI